MHNHPAMAVDNHCKQYAAKGPRNAVVVNVVVFDSDPVVHVCCQSEAPVDICWAAEVLVFVIDCDT